MLTRALTPLVLFGLGSLGCNHDGPPPSERAPAPVVASAAPAATPSSTTTTISDGDRTEGEEGQVGRARGEEGRMGPPSGRGEGGAGILGVFAADAGVATGNMFGDDIGEAFGAGGLGFSGGDGGASGIGLGGFGTLGTLRAPYRFGPADAAHFMGTTRSDGVAGLAHIIAGLRQKDADYLACYTRALASSPNLAGKIGVRFTVDAGGAIVDAQSVDVTIQSTAVIACVVAAVRSVKIDKPEVVGAPVTHTLDFALKTAPHIRIRESGAQVSGRLPPEVVRRVMRQHFGAARQCYVAGLSRDPNMAGTVDISLVIDRNGAVAGADARSAEIKDAALLACEKAAFGGVSFPAPEGGTVAVKYSIRFTNE